MVQAVTGGAWVEIVIAALSVVFVVVVVIATKGTRSKGE